MDIVDTLIALEKIGFSQTAIANYCHCHKTTISKLIRKEIKLTDKMAYLIQDGLEHLYNDIKNIIGE